MQGDLTAWGRDTQRGPPEVDPERASECLARVSNRIDFAKRARERVADSARVQWVPGMQAKAIGKGCSPELTGERLVGIVEIQDSEAHRQRTPDRLSCAP